MILREFYIKKQQEEAEFLSLFDGFVEAAFDEMERRLDNIIKGKDKAHPPHQVSDIRQPLNGVNYDD